MNSYLTVLQKYAVFGGRAGRSEFWMFVLMNIIISFALSFLGTTIGYVYSLAVFIPSLAVAVRRLHDTGRSGWWLLIGLIPLIGWITLIVFYALDSQPGDNMYGSNPKGVVAMAAPTPPAAPAAL